jgi:predicted aspartyl protease
MYSHDYSFEYSPSMPAVEVSLGLTRGQIVLTLPAIVDSEADGTLVPIRYLDQVGALPAGTQWLSGITGERSEVEIYPVYIQLGKYSLHIRVVGDEVNREIILGRDVLNQCVVTLNGLAAVVEISQ